MNDAANTRPTFYVTTENGYYIAGPMTYADACSRADDREGLTGREHNVVNGAENAIGAPDND